MNYLEYFNSLIISNISKIQRLSSAKLEDSLKEHDLSLSEFRIVGLLLGEECGYSQKDLANLLGITSASLSVSIQRLERKKVIQRFSDNDDQRVKRIRISPQVDFSSIYETLSKLEESAVRDISPGDLSTTKRVLKQVLLNINPEAHEELKEVDK